MSEISVTIKNQSIRVTQKNEQIIIRTVVTNTLQTINAGGAEITQTITDGDTTHSPSGDAVFDALALKAPLVSPTFTGVPLSTTPSAGDSSKKVATTEFVDGELNTGMTDVSITDATVLDDSAFGKVHVCSGSTYNLTLPTPAAGNYGKTIPIKGDPALTGKVTLVGVVDGETDTRQISAYGFILLESVSGGYRMLPESDGWMTYSTTVTGFSSNPTGLLLRFCRVGKTLKFYITDTATGTGTGTTVTFTLPHNVSANVQRGACQVVNNGAATTSPGMWVTRANSNIVDCYVTWAGGGWTGSNARAIRAFGEIELA